MTLEDAAKNSAGDNAQWWFNTRSGEVEFGLLTASVYRIGPFASREEALGALDTVRRRSKEWAEAEASEDD